MRERRSRATAQMLADTAVRAKTLGKFLGLDDEEDDIFSCREHGPFKPVEFGSSVCPVCGADKTKGDSPPKVMLGSTATR